MLIDGTQIGMVDRLIAALAMVVFLAFIVGFAVAMKVTSGVVGGIAGTFGLGVYGVVLGWRSRVNRNRSESVASR